MFTFELSDEERLIKETAAEFGKFLREMSRKVEKDGVTDEIKKKYDELGFAYTDIPQELGGYGYGVFRKVLSLQEMAFGCAATTLYLELPSICLHLINLSEMPSELKQKFKEEVMLYPWGIYIDFDGNFSYKDGVFQGKAYAVLGKDIRIFALIKDEKVFIFDEFEIQKKKPLALDAVGVSEITLKNHQPKMSFPVKFKQFVSILRVYLSALLSGIIKASFDYSSKYALEREAFGKKIAHHQGLAFILSDFSIAVSSCELYTWRGAWAIDTNQENFFQICADAFSHTAEMAERFTIWGVQILGGHGFVKDHPVEKWMREAKAISLLFGGKYYAEVDSSEI